MPSCFDLYMNMYERAKKGERFDSENEINKNFPGLKSGKFAENVFQKYLKIIKSKQRVKIES